MTSADVLGHGEDQTVDVEGRSCLKFAHKASAQADFQRAVCPRLKHVVEVCLNVDCANDSWAIDELSIEVKTLFAVDEFGLDAIHRLEDDRKPSMALSMPKFRSS